MREVVDVVNFYTDDEVSDLMIKASIEMDAESLIQLGESWSFQLAATNGELHLQSTIHSEELIRRKHPTNNKTTAEWELLVYQLFFNQLPKGGKKSISITVTQTPDDFYELDIALVLGSSIKQTLGKVGLNLVRDDDDYIEQNFNLFDWAKLLKQERDQSTDQALDLQEQIQHLEAQLSQSIESQEQLVENLQRKEEHRLKVFTSLLNDFQEFNQGVLDGKIMKTEDHFNIDYIKQVIERTNLKEEKPQPKKRKITKKVNAEPPKKAAGLERKVKEESSEAISEEEEPRKAIRVHSLPSEKFEFSNKVVKEEEQEDNPTDDDEELSGSQDSQEQETDGGNEGIDQDWTDGDDD